MSDEGLLALDVEPTGLLSDPSKVPTGTCIQFDGPTGEVLQLNTRSGGVWSLNFLETQYIEHYHYIPSCLIPRL